MFSASRQPAAKDQMFQPIAPRVRQTVNYDAVPNVFGRFSITHSLEILFTVPVRSQQTKLTEMPRLPPSQPEGDIIQMEKSALKLASASHHNELCGLPMELHLLIISFLDIKDAVSLFIANTYFLSLAPHVLDNYFLSGQGQWAGKSLVCVSQECEPGDYPPGLFSEAEVDAFNTMTYDPPFNLYTFTKPSVSEVVNPFHVQLVMHLDTLTRDCGLLYGEDPAFAHIEPLLSRSWHDHCETYLPSHQPWVLRNLTTKQVVHAERILPSPTHRPLYGTERVGRGFGLVLFLRTYWFSSPSADLENGPTNVSRGVWAGHRFDITTLIRHEAKTGGEEWDDVSDEVVRDIADFMKPTYGEEWRSRL
ncbi:hypothetical protein GGR57DRAFT_519636 [Xylariaceae sp. FL1272]|nr:hypothetical protein GGR57DRAFT_519636 [Xylariaceae sp. FL1272]